jgi:hypothetical protein
MVGVGIKDSNPMSRRNHWDPFLLGGPQSKIHLLLLFGLNFYFLIQYYKSKNLPKEFYFSYRNIFHIYYFQRGISIKVIIQLLDFISLIIFTSCSGGKAKKTTEETVEKPIALLGT